MKRHSSADHVISQAGIDFTVEFGRRLREERAKTSTNQRAFGERAGVVLDSQSRYETGKTQPNAEYLARLAQVGVDVLYLLTGRRSESKLLSREASELLDAFTDLEPALQEATLTMMRNLRDGPGGRPRAPAPNNDQREYEESG
jgi:transcriptional regulator with XRE-family HTH domain